MSYNCKSLCFRNRKISAIRFLYPELQFMRYIFESKRYIAVFICRDTAFKQKIALCVCQLICACIKTAHLERINIIEFLFFRNGIYRSVNIFHGLGRIPAYRLRFIKVSFGGDTCHILPDSIAVIIFTGGILYFQYKVLVKLRIRNKNDILFLLTCLNMRHISADFRIGAVNDSVHTVDSVTGNIQVFEPDGIFFIH